ncbi:palmitoyltransferase ZDHHC22-like [Asterias amurensis]|uniref:palmitoyltransferase ZDHHC22-like n=1 Tax=Asterias amurensis TaxID=7602 RepID=UPI003AB81E2C
MDVGAKLKEWLSFFTEPTAKRLMLIANIGGVGYYWVVSLLVFYVNLFVIIPSILSENLGWMRFQWWFFVVAYFNMMLNYLICLSKKSRYTSTEGIVTEEASSKGWGYCVPCQQYSPPRTHHCSVCKHCILKRDQHCFFLGACIGHFNQRYFLVFLFYASISALHAAVCFFTYLNQYFATFLSLDFYCYFFPIATTKWVLGYTPSHLFGILALFYMCLMLGFGCIGFFTFHFQRALHCQTSYEFSHRVTTYSRGPQRNLQEIFGSYWWLAFLVPIPQKQTSDGIVWNKPKELKGY